MARLDAFLKIGREEGGSDIHLTVGLPPLVRIDGELLPIKYRALTQDETEGLVREVLSEAQRALFDERGTVDLSYASEEAGRFRINVCRHSRGIGAACRVIPEAIPKLADLGLPRVINRFTSLSSGLILVTRPHGPGKA